MRCTTGLLLFFLLNAMAAAGGIYKWTDADGNVHFGDRPDTDEAQELSIKTRPAPQPTASGNTARPVSPSGISISDVMEEERLRRKEERDRKKNQRDRRERNCVLARDKLRSYEEADYLYDIDSTGNRHALSTEERADAEARVRAEVREWCS